MGLDYELSPPDPEQSAPRISSIAPIEGWFCHNFHLIPGLFDILENQIWEWNAVSFSLCVFPWNNHRPGLSWQDSGMGGASPRVSMETPILTTTCGLEYLKVMGVQEYNWEFPPLRWSKIIQGIDALKEVRRSPGWWGSNDWLQAWEQKNLSPIPSEGTCLGCKPGPQ